MTPVFLHGAGLNGESWPSSLRSLGFCPSYPGRPEGPALSRIEDLADWISPLLPEDPLLIGHSMGGALALELALRGRASALLLLSTGARLKVLPALRALLQNAAEQGEPSVEVASLACQDPETAAWIRQKEQQVPSSTAWADWQATHAFDRLSEVSRLRLPTTLLVGELDLLTPPKYSFFLKDAIPGARLEVLPGVGHMLPWEATERLLQAIPQPASASSSILSSVSAERLT
jgi:pimeloyl-ACP methyl ester carboxylesterase